MMTLTGWDWLIVVVLLLSTALGYWRGAVRTLFGLGAWVVGVIAAPFVASHLQSMLGSGAVPAWVLLIAAFLIAYLVIRWAGALILKGIRSIGLAGVDRVFGGALGVARAGLIVLVVAVAGYRFGLAQEVAWKEAHSRPLLEWMVASAEPWLPAEMRQPRSTASSSSAALATPALRAPPAGRPEPHQRPSGV